MTKKKFFDYVIGNPPYQMDVIGNNRKKPVYNEFMDAAYNLAEKVELITPARFLFNAGQTPKDWNKKMLSDNHLKVLVYESNASKFFMNSVEIKGGVAITYRDASKTYNSIGSFIPNNNLRSILSKTKNKALNFLDAEVVRAVPYKFSDLLRREHPELIGLIGNSFDLRTNILDKLNGKIFFKEKPNDDYTYEEIIGILNKKRVVMWIRQEYIINAQNFNSYKVLISKASGKGEYGEKLVEPFVANKNVGQTQSFVSIGSFNTHEEAENLCKYIKCKYTRSLIGLQKVTQDITARCFKYVPIQNFTSSSDIDWSKSVHNIDFQLYRKYKLSTDEINFIETHVKEMA